MQISCLRNTLLITIVGTSGLFAQPYGEPDRKSPGDRAIQQYMALRTRSIHASFDKDRFSLEAWKSQRKKYLQEYFYMLALWPQPAKTPLRATVMGTLQGDGQAARLRFFPIGTTRKRLDIGKHHFVL